MAASEAIPYAKTGGLADVTGALPQELGRLGHDVILMMPRYRCLNDSGRSFRVIGRIPVMTPQGASEAIIEEDTLSLGGASRAVRVWAFRQDAYFDREGLYQDQGRDYSDNLERFAWFSRAVIEAIQYLRHQWDWSTDLLHLHDWQTALCAVYLKTASRGQTELAGIKTVLTLHNIGYQGLFSGNRVEQAGLPSSLFTPEGLEFYGSTNLLKGGMVFADHLTTVSPTYAKEILTPEFGFGLEGVLRTREHELSGIVNGIDMERWNPETDPLLQTNYSVENRAGKLGCKQALQREFGLPERDIPLISVIARLTQQKGLDLVAAILPKMLKLDVQLVMLGTGDHELERTFLKFHERFRNRMGVHIGFDEALAHRIEGGSDMIVMPSRYEPCGLTQLYSLRYGTVPVVRKTGGLADTVIPVNDAQDGGIAATGFHFEQANSESLFEVMERALRLYANRARWERLVVAGMQTDMSWTNSARQYDEIFTRITRGGRKSEAEVSEPAGRP